METKCSHCGAIFTPSVRMAKRIRAEGNNGAVHRHACSHACMCALISSGKKRPYPYWADCPTCHAHFGSRQPKKYCSLRCYTTSPEFLSRLKAHRDERSTRAGEHSKRSDPVGWACKSCGVVTYSPPAKARYRKFCGQSCYREYMARRFDRWIASPQSMALPQAYDEFLSQEELCCLIEGCGWKGQWLSHHMNFAHGTPAKEFKRAAGFNLTTGVITPRLFKTLSSRAHVHMAFAGPGAAEQRRANGRKARGSVREYHSLEGAEHSAKARALMYMTISPPPARECRGCGATFTPGPIAWAAKFCTFECRDRHYAKRNKNKQLSGEFGTATCRECGKDFNLSKERTTPSYLRDHGHTGPFCSFHCRAVAAGRKGRHKDSDELATGGTS